ncbi:MAG: hypothetical protein ABSD28_06085 [Tepidisphaeraceae bacterium]
MLVPELVRDCVAFVGYWESPKEFKIGATAFFTIVDLPGGQGPLASATYVVTAKHVINAIRKRSFNQKVILRINCVGQTTMDIESPCDEWITHPKDENVDVAVLSIEYPERGHVLCLGRGNIDEKEHGERFGIGDNVFIVGLFTEHSGSKRNLPILRTGNIAAKPEEPVKTCFGLAEAYLIEARSIGGLSGSPVFVQLGDLRQDYELKKALQESGEPPPEFSGINPPRFFLLGMIHGHYDTKPSDVFPDIDEDVTTTESAAIRTGIALVVPSKKILEVLDHPRFIEDRKRRAQQWFADHSAVPDGSI